MVGRRYFFCHQLVRIESLVSSTREDSRRRRATSAMRMRYCTFCCPPRVAPSWYSACFPVFFAHLMGPPSSRGRGGGAFSTPVPVAARCHPVSWIWREQNVNAHVVLRGQAAHVPLLCGDTNRAVGLSGWWSGKGATCVRTVPRTCANFLNKDSIDFCS